LQTYSGDSLLLKDFLKQLVILRVAYAQRMVFNDCAPDERDKEPNDMPTLSPAHVPTTMTTAKAVNIVAKLNSEADADEYYAVEEYRPGFAKIAYYEVGFGFIAYL